jgi:putative hydrolase of the HAD superfamily
VEGHAKGRRFKAVVFDLYGTLVDNFSLAVHEGVLREMAAIVGAPSEDFVRKWFDSYEWRAIGKITSPEANIELICRQLGVPLNEDRIREAAQVRYEFTRQGLKPWPEAVPVLSRLKTLGYKLALISDCSAETPSSWEHTPIASLMDVTVFSCVVGLKKPDPHIFLQAAERLGVETEECLYIGDGSSQELSGAAAVGMHPVMIRAPSEAPDAHRVHEEEWKGRKIALLTEVLDIVSENRP